MEENEMKTGIEQNEPLTQVTENDNCKRPLSADECKDFFPELTKEFDNLKKELESSTRDFEGSVILSATTFLENLVGTALNEIEKRIESTYNEELEVQRTLYKLFNVVHKKDLKNLSDIKEFNKDSAIALQSLIPQLRKIINIYRVPLENVIERRTKGGYLLRKIEQVQDIIARFKKGSVNSKTYIDYEKNFLSAYILAKRIEEEDRLFNIDGFSSRVEKVCSLLESEEDITHLLKDMSSDLFLYIYTFSGEASYICLKLREETLSTKRVFNIIKDHYRSSYLPKSSELLEKLKQLEESTEARFMGLESLIQNNFDKERAHFDEGLKAVGIELGEAKAQNSWTLEKVRGEFVKKMGLDNSYTAAMFSNLILELSDKQDPETGEWIKGKTYKQAAEEFTKVGHPISDSTLCDRIHKIEVMAERKLVFKMPRGKRSIKRSK